MTDTDLPAEPPAAPAPADLRASGDQVGEALAALERTLGDPSPASAPLPAGLSHGDAWRRLAASAMDQAGVVLAGAVPFLALASIGRSPIRIPQGLIDEIVDPRAPVYQGSGPTIDGAGFLLWLLLTAGAAYLYQVGTWIRLKGTIGQRILAMQIGDHRDGARLSLAAASTRSLVLLLPVVIPVAAIGLMPSGTSCDLRTWPSGCAAAPSDVFDVPLLLVAACWPAIVLGGVAVGAARRGFHDRLVGSMVVAPGVFRPTALLPAGDGTSVGGPAAGGSTGRRVEVAPPLGRIVAVLIDWVILVVAGAGVQFLLDVVGSWHSTTGEFTYQGASYVMGLGLPGGDAAWFGAITLGLSAVYWIGSALVMRGSPGQRLVGLRVIQVPNGGPLSAELATARWLAIGFLVWLQMLGLTLGGFGILMALAISLWQLALVISIGRSPAGRGFVDRQTESLVARVS